MMMTLITMIAIYIILVLVGLITKKENNASGHASEFAGKPGCTATAI